MSRALALRTACALALLTTTTSAAPHTHERAAVIDLGSGDAAVRQQLATRVMAAGLDPVIGGGVEDALAGVLIDRDAVQLAATLAEAQRAFGALDCDAAIAASSTAIGVAAARQAAHLPVPELPRALTYSLLCAERRGDVDGAMRAAARLRSVGGSAEVPSDVWRKYPDVDAAIDRDMVPLDLRAEVDGAEIWIDFAPVGTSPLRVVVPAGDHVIAAASGTRRGWASGTTVASQTVINIPMGQQVGPWREVAQRVASWKGSRISPAELAAVLDAVKARVALVRRGNTIEAWGRVSSGDSPRRLGGDEGAGPLTEVDRVLAVVVDRVQAWNDRAPDPDQPLLVEDVRERAARKDAPTTWWVYASIFGAIGAAATFVYLHDSAANTQHVELHYP